MTTTARTTPHGIPLDDGFSTKIALSGDPDISFWEVTAQPPGIDGGDPKDKTTMHNVTWRTQAARKLKTLTNSKTTVRYDPQIYPLVLLQINVNQWITCSFPNGDTLDFCGYVKSFVPGDHAEGTPPEAEVEIIPTNEDPTSHAETAPVFTEASSAT